MIALYIKSDTHQQSFISFLNKVIKSCEQTNKNRSWSYVVAEMIAKIVNRYESLVQILLENQVIDNDSKTVIYKYSITITEDLYSKPSNKLIDYIKISCIDKNDPFDGLFKDFYQKIVHDNNNDYRINELKAEIEDKQKELDELYKDKKAL